MREDARIPIDGLPAETLPVTRLLTQASAGDRSALDALAPLVESELRCRAEAYMRRERCGHTLQVTVLINEAFLTLVDDHDIAWRDRSHFYAVASISMRRVLREHAQKHNAAKRGGGHAERLPLESVEQSVSGDGSVDFLDLDDALTRLESDDKTLGRVVELLFFCGLSCREAGRVLGLDARTVSRKWAAARSILYDLLKGGQNASDRGPAGDSGSA